MSQPAVPSRWSRRAVLGTGLLAAGLAGCSSSTSSTAPTDPSTGPAEPGTAPSPTTAPAGTVVAVGDGPQGIVYAAHPPTVAVALRSPYRLALLDPTTLAAGRSVALPGKVRHLQLSADGTTVLVPSETANQLLQVPLAGGPPVVTRVQRHPHDAAGAADGEVLVGNEFSGSLSFVRDGRVLRTVSDLEQPGGVVVVGSTVVVVDVRAFTISTYALATGRRTARLAAGAGPTHVVATGSGRVAVTDTRGGRLLVYAVDPLRRVGAIDLPGSPYGLTADATGTAWVSLIATNRLVGVDVTGVPRRVATYPTVQQPDTVAVDPGGRTLWVTGTTDGVVQRISR